MHHWQDLVLAISVCAFNIALIPSVLGKQKPRLATSVMTACFLVPEIVVFANLSLWYSFVMALTNALLWIALAIQQYERTRRP